MSFRSLALALTLFPSLAGFPATKYPLERYGSNPGFRPLVTPPFVTADPLHILNDKSLIEN